MGAVARSGWGQGSVVPLLGLGTSILAVAAVALSVQDAPSFIDALLLGGPGTAVVLVALWVAQSDLPTARYRRITAWAVGGGVGLVAVVGLLILTPTTDIEHPAFALALGVGVGAFAGLLNGANEARAITSATRAEYERVASAMAEEQRERLEWLNHLLRHDILNDVAVIRARVDALESTAGDSEHLDSIRRQADAIDELIRNVRTFLESVDDAELRPVDLVGLVEREVASVATSHTEATVATDLPARAAVRADGLVDSIVSNLVRNAVVHNDAPSVTVAVDPGPETTTLRVTDDGEGLPDYLRGRVFERTDGGDHGFGLYLVGRLAERYGGVARVADTGPDGTTFVVELPTASDDVGTGAA